MGKYLIYFIFRISVNGVLDGMSDCGDGSDEARFGRAGDLWEKLEAEKESSSTTTGSTTTFKSISSSTSLSPTKMMTEFVSQEIRRMTTAVTPSLSSAVPPAGQEPQGDVRPADASLKASGQAGSTLGGDSRGCEVGQGGGEAIELRLILDFIEENW